MTQVINVKDLADTIKSGKYPTQEVNLLQFFNKTIIGEYYPNRDTRIQVRERDRDIDRINRAVNKMKASGDFSGLESPTLIKMPDDNLKVVNGNHTIEMMVNLDMTTAQAYIVDYEKQLNGLGSNATRLGNLLNKQDVEKVDIHDSDIKRELFQLMSEREESNLSARPSEDILQEFIDVYPHISRKTIGQWISNHENVGGRRKPLISYTTGEIQLNFDLFKNMQRYVDYSICRPQTFGHWRDTAISTAFTQMMADKGNKALILFYCSTVTQANDWENKKEDVEKFYAEMSQYWNCTIECEMLRYE